ncbi:hypothetical protein O9929_08750 [Vibrio lentus]|nr:hypothetical protein [Vibrio lentus]
MLSNTPVTLATGMAIAGDKPIVAIYSTFLACVSRSADPHDVAIMDPHTGYVRD